jgi:erythromycin esterase-like protein
VHVAKDLSGVDGFAGRTPLGMLIKRDVGDRAFALGFSAYSGEYAFVRQPVRELDAAPASSLEGRVFANGASDSVYVSRAQLQKYGPVAARALGNTFKTAEWNKVLDGTVIFRKEHAPAWVHR